ncbi:MAG: alpha/beta hydrolase-fold protein [Anaerolineae bacterium]
MWRHYLQDKDPNLHSIVGDVRVLDQVYSPQLHNRRDVLVYLPPSYWHSDRHYPVAYMHDGQNLFDRATSFVGEWEVDETMETLADEGIEAIIVALPNMDKERVHEYGPFDSQRFGKTKGDRYGEFILDTVKPLIDREFRTLRQGTATGIVGSSLGGLISLYLFFRYPRAFGYAGVMSPSLWFAGGQIVPFVADAAYVPGRLYLDIGQRERVGWMGHIKQHTSMGVRSASVESMSELLQAKGYRLGQNLMYVEDQLGDHNEASWARRLPDALRFLLGR